LATKKAKKEQKAPEASASSSKNSRKSIITRLLGKRKCAAEASERIAHFSSQELHSGNSSDNDAEADSDSDEASPTSRETRTRSSRRQQTNDSKKSAVAAAPKRSPDHGARAKRRKAVDDQIEGMFNPTALEEMLLSMMKHRDGWPFDRPITKSEAPDYHRVIKRPMDLGTIRTAILRMKYTCNQEVLDDIRLVFANCWQYNREDAEEYQCGIRLEAYFRKEAKKLGLLFDDDDEERENNVPATVNDEDEAPKAKRNRRTF
jgi:bromodomain adjacent to zinc finger domain protein 1A